MDGEKRAARRTPVDATVRIRAAGSDGHGIACRVRDSSAAGSRLVSDEEIRAEWSRIEVLKSSGQPLTEPIGARVVRTETDADGRQEIGCSFD